MVSTCLRVIRCKPFYQCVRPLFRKPYVQATSTISIKSWRMKNVCNQYIYYYRLIPGIMYFKNKKGFPHILATESKPFLKLASKTNTQNLRDNQTHAKITLSDPRLGPSEGQTAVSVLRGGLRIICLVARVGLRRRRFRWCRPAHVLPSCAQVHAIECTH